MKVIECTYLHEMQVVTGENVVPSYSAIQQIPVVTDVLLIYQIHTGVTLLA